MSTQLYMEIGSPTTNPESKHHMAPRDWATRRRKRRKMAARSRQRNGRSG